MTDAFTLAAWNHTAARNALTRVPLSRRPSDMQASKPPLFPPLPNYYTALVEPEARFKVVEVIAKQDAPELTFAELFQSVPINWKK